MTSRDMLDKRLLNLNRLFDNKIYQFVDVVRELTVQHVE